MEWSDNKEKEKKNYYKIKHLVEVDDDILAVFIMTSGQIKEVYISKSSKLDKNYIDSLVSKLSLGISFKHIEISNENQSKDHINLGKIKWLVIEYENLRILQLFEYKKNVFVLMNSNIQLENTVDSILSYYYDLDDIPKSLF